MRHFDLLDRAILELDKALQTRAGAKKLAQRPTPVPESNSDNITDEQKLTAARLMRVNHSGEVAAQALYQGQAFTAKLDSVREQMQHAADEEIDHLAWCEDRLDELGAKPSILNPVWYAGSFAIGALAGIAGDKWSLGFVEETERQVVDHLQEHLDKLPENDQRTRAIIEQMQSDEAEHGDMAKDAGAADLPRPIKALMKLTSKVMTRSSYWI
ncbi:MAG: 2-polyprenyl-3-methyl-6-methoxy-1,4-benzoquinone monooxygenase [Gammaproteobacteria bacterium]|nr:2-polyprenyl-3-methyl-6-methoxy-1,4-benzoquinone monooxygenase [Gammaproteobacteria bacterium]NNC97620.1 2-polyprenyl-3-methyl-6-methoxy-1,4-benzoquinone monooxygenase [Gammaproteobacteria bacterium]NNM14194.1 2-polyprenyl-3-methyl-6-methoxy-1,4-benzoquinone monooxygenase [Gammaproteobacteria bacterium]